MIDKKSLKNLPCGGYKIIIVTWRLMLCQLEWDIWNSETILYIYWWWKWHLFVLESSWSKMWESVNSMDDAMNEKETENKWNSKPWHDTGLQDTWREHDTRWAWYSTTGPIIVNERNARYTSKILSFARIVCTWSITNPLKFDLPIHRSNIEFPFPPFF